MGTWATEEIVRFGLCYIRVKVRIGLGLRLGGGRERYRDIQWKDGTYAMEEILIF